MACNGISVAFRRSGRLNVLAMGVLSRILNGDGVESVDNNPATASDVEGFKFDESEAPITRRYVGANAGRLVGHGECRGFSGSFGRCSRVRLWSLGSLGVISMEWWRLSCWKAIGMRCQKCDVSPKKILTSGIIRVNYS